MSEAERLWCDSCWELYGFSLLICVEKGELRLYELRFGLPEIRENGWHTMFNTTWHIWCRGRHAVYLRVQEAQADFERMCEWF